MVEKQCLSYDWFGKCGLAGTCERNQIMGRCVCKVGWFQTWELSPYFDRRTATSLSQLPCMEHRNFLAALYIAAAVASLVCFILSLRQVVSTRHQLPYKRKITIMPLLFCPIVIGVIAMLFERPWKLSDAFKFSFHDFGRASLGNRCFFSVHLFQ